MRLCFGSKGLRRKQHDLEANEFSSNGERLRDWRSAHSDEFFEQGSRDDKADCELCVAAVAEEGSLTLNLRLPDCLASQQGKYLVIPGIRFRYGHLWVLAALENNAESAAFRCQHGEKAARQSGLGQAVNYRFQRDDKGRRVFVTTKMVESPPVTDRSREPSAWT
ncbi:MAG: hypothetical protein OXR67_15255 [Chloroflexota bacterium]|nr:hypothetical protein [Chloroflexota bacterium]